jgi:hypothetical protein
MVEVVMVPNGCGGEDEGKVEAGQQQGQVLSLVLAALRKSMVLPCQMADADDPAAGAAWGMEIGWPTDVRHVAHVTFDRLRGFLGLPVEFEIEIPGQVPSARYGFRNSPLFLDECSVSSSISDISLNSSSASVFGVSPESMQCGYDDKGNSVPKILLLMQERLYTQDGLKVRILHYRFLSCELKCSQIDSFWTFSRIFQAEGIFRITPENSREEHVREQLNSGIVPDDIDVHCLASLIKVNNTLCRSLPRRYD